MNNQIINIKRQMIESFTSFENLLNLGKNLGISFDDDVQKKLNDVKQTLSKGKIKVALVGGFSEGKTTLAASWLGYIEDNMKIDPDESSDDIIVYHPIGLENDCEIIDTPGLYGSKSFEDGSLFKEKTLNFVSEAHLILFVLDPVNPIKDSHKDTIHWLFRDLNKIDSVIFVINKMDMVADLTDPEDFQDQFEIKKKSIEKALDRMISLTEKEKQSLNITAVAANPKGKGLEFWFNRKEDYNNRSRINNLRAITNKILSDSKEILVKRANFSVIQDVVLKQNKATIKILQEYDQSITQRKDTLDNLIRDYDRAYQQIISIKAPLKESLISYKKELILKFNGADVNTFPELVIEEIGNEAINFQSRLLSLIENYTNEINGIANSLNKSFESEINFAESFFEKHNDWIKQGINGLKAIPVSQWHGIINSSRHFLNGTFNTAIKFKPWGITKLAKGTTATMGVLGLAIEAWETISTIGKKNKIDNAKKEIVNLVSETIDEQLKIINDQEKFLQTFAPNLNKMKGQIDIFEDAYSSVQNQKQKIEEWFTKVGNFRFEEIEDVEFVELKE